MLDHLANCTCLDAVIKASLMIFYNEIENFLRDTHIPSDLTIDPNVTYYLLETIIRSAKDKHMKPVKARLNIYKYKKNP